MWDSSGKNHNVIRHPDMPPEAFADLCETLKAGKPWMGLVKNRCKNGSFYWVDAYVSPQFINGSISGYQSVRVKPKREWVSRADALYKKIMRNKSDDDKRRSKLEAVSLERIHIGFTAKLMIAVVSSFIPMVAATIYLREPGLFAFFGTLSVSLIVAYLGINHVVKPVNNLAKRSAGIIINPA